MSGAIIAVTSDNGGGRPRGGLEQVRSSPSVERPGVNEYRPELPGRMGSGLTGPAVRPAGRLAPVFRGSVFRRARPSGTGSPRDVCQYRQAAVTVFRSTPS